MRRALYGEFAWDTIAGKLTPTNNVGSAVALKSGPSDIRIGVEGAAGAGETLCKQGRVSRGPICRCFIKS